MFLRSSELLPMGIITPICFAGKVIFIPSIAGIKSVSPVIRIAVSNSLLIAHWKSLTAMFTSVCFSSKVEYSFLQILHL
jgi:hypothetical protein